MSASEGVGIKSRNGLGVADIWDRYTESGGSAGNDREKEVI